MSRIQQNMALVGINKMLFIKHLCNCYMQKHQKFCLCQQRVSLCSMYGSVFLRLVLLTISTNGEAFLFIKPSNEDRCTITKLVTKLQISINI